MPFTPYHFGINALPGLGSQGRLNIIVLISANVIIDTEVLANYFFSPGWPVHQIWHFHTLLAGGLVGAVFGFIAYRIKSLRRICHSLNRLHGFSYSPTMMSFVLSGIIGAWLHVLVDGLFHYDVQIFWPIQDNLLLRWASGIHWLRTHVINQGIIRLCVLAWIIAGILSTYFFCRQFLIHKKANLLD